MARFKSILIAGAALALLLPVSLANAAEPADAPVTANAPAISVTKVRMGVISEMVLGSGLIEPVEKVFVQPQIEGQAVDSIAVDVGSRVREGQVLAKLSDSTLLLKKSQLLASQASAEANVAVAAAQVIEAQAAADEAVRVRSRTQTLAEKGLAAQSKSEQSESSAESAMARVTSAKKNKAAAEAQLKVIAAQIADVDLQLSRTAIKAPVSGLVVERNAQVGGIASAAGGSMFVLLRDGLLELRADLAEQDVLRVAPGQEVLMHIAGQTEALRGTVRLVEPSVSTTTRLGRVRISIEDPSKVRMGMFADAEILVVRKETLIAPVSAIGGSSSGAVALKVEDGLVKAVPVEPGIREGEWVEVVTGLKEGDTVVAKAGSFVRDGDRVNPVLVETPSLDSLN